MAKSFCEAMFKNGLIAKATQKDTIRLSPHLAIK